MSLYFCPHKLEFDVRIGMWSNWYLPIKNLAIQKWRGVTIWINQVSWTGSTVMSGSIIIPAYNEEEGISRVLGELLEVLANSKLTTYEIIVVDDGSTDRTAQRVKERDGVMLVRHHRNRGYGAALKTGIVRATHDWIIITDADGTYPNHRIPDLMREAEGSDMVVGSRTGTNVVYPTLRKIPKAFLRRYAEWVGRAPIEDMNSGLRVFRRSVARRLLHLLPDGFSFTTTITLAMMTNHYVIRYIPIDYAARIGNSKIRPIRDTLNFLVLIVRTGTYFAPFRVFMPIALVFFLLFMSSAAYDIVKLQNLTDKTLILLTLSMNIGLFALVADMVHKRTGI